MLDSSSERRGGCVIPYVVAGLKRKKRTLSLSGKEENRDIDFTRY